MVICDKFNDILINLMIYDKFNCPKKMEEWVDIIMRGNNISRLRKKENVLNLEN